MRVLALDLGSKRIGVAVSDWLGITVNPVETIHRSGAEFERIKTLVKELEPQEVVIGLPLRLDNTVGDAAKGALAFAERLRTEIDIPVFTQDEKLTSAEAEQMMIERGFDRRRRKAMSDQFAAMIILQDYLSNSTKKN